MGNRQATAGFLAELTAGVNRPFLLFEGVFGATTLRYNTLANDISWNSLTWVGDGTFKAPPVVAESKSVVASGISIALAGEPSVLISTLLNNASHSGTGKLWFGFLNSSRQVIADPRLIFKGTLSTAPFSDGVESATITLNYESELINVLNNNEFRYNLKTQQLFYPNDTGFKYMEALANWSGYWGKKKARKKKAKKNKGKD